MEAHPAAVQALKKVTGDTPEQRAKSARELAETLAAESQLKVPHSLSYHPSPIWRSAANMPDLCSLCSSI